MPAHTRLMSLSMYVTRFHEDDHQHSEAALLHLRPVQDFRPHLVDIPCDSMSDCVAMCCSDDCIGSHRQCRERLPVVISMTCWNHGLKMREKDRNRERGDNAVLSMLDHLRRGEWN